MNTLKKLDVSLLYIEPENSTREKFAKIIEGQVTTLFVAEDGNEGINLFKENKPDIVIANITMPHLSGLDLANEIKSTNKDTQIILAVTNEESQFLYKSINMGICHYIFKPLSQEKLTSAITTSAEAILLRRKIQQQNELITQSQAALSNEKKKFLAISENAPFGIMLLDKDGTFKYLNPKFKKLFGYELVDIPNGKAWFQRAFPDSIYRHEIISTWIKETEAESVRIKAPWILTVTCKDGTKKIVNFIPAKLDTGEFVVSCEDMTELKKNENKLLHIANYDSLTGLPNRRSLEFALRETIDQASKGKRRGNLSALLFVDIDDFKDINQSFGHGSGDEVLITLGKLLSKGLRTRDDAFRFGGDEFAVLFRGISMAEARLAAERLQRMVNQYIFVLDYTKYNLNVSIGIIQINGEMDYVTLLSNAAKTMHKAKEFGKNYIAVY